MKSTNLNYKVNKFLSWLLFIIYIIVLLYLLFFSEYYGRQETREYRYNLKLFNEIKRCFNNIEVIGMRSFITNIFGNIAAFVPFGFFLPILDEKEDSFFKILFKTAIFSLCIESIQLYFRVGSFDVDDILLNTLGGILGIIMYKLIIKRYFRRVKNKRS